MSEPRLADASVTNRDSPLIRVRLIRLDLAHALARRLRVLVVVHEDAENRDHDCRREESEPFVAADRSVRRSRRADEHDEAEEAPAPRVCLVAEAADVPDPIEGEPEDAGEVEDDEDRAQGVHEDRELFLHFESPFVRLGLYADWPKPSSAR